MDALTTVLDLTAIALVIAGAFFIAFGLGVIACGAGLAFISLGISRRKPAE